jgi:membrane protease YdiL (CAAX protease family)
VSFYPTPGWPGPAPGWYVDPWESCRWRWWDGYGWTGFVSITGLDARYPDPSGDAVTEGGIRGLGVAAVGTLIALFLSGLFTVPWILASQAHYGFVDKSSLAANPWVLLFSEIGLWAGWIGACIYASRHNGTGSMEIDYGFGLPQKRDFGVGIGAGFIGRAISVVIAVVVTFIAAGNSPVHSGGGHSRSVIGFSPHSWWAWAVIVVISCLGAPVVEELFFRGLVQGALVRKWGVQWGIALTAIIFTAAHVTDQGIYALPVLLPMAIILGWMRQHYGRLAPGIIAHVIFNSLGLVALLAITGVR